MRFIIIIVLLLIAKNSFATAQMGELILYKGDTLTLFTEPLYTYLNRKENLSRQKWLFTMGCSTGLWRGYQAIWEISDHKLTLIDVYLCADRNKSIKKDLFPYSEGEIHADCFTGPLYLQHGQLLRYVHFGFGSVLEKEIQINLIDGVVQTTIHYTNGIKPDDSGHPRDSGKIQQYIYEHLNWELFPKLSKKIYLSPFFQIDAQGYIADISLHGKADSVYKTELLRILTNMPKLQIIYKRDEAYIEYKSIPILFSKQMKKRYIKGF